MSDQIMQRPFVKGLDLCHAFFTEAVRPLLSQHFPHLRYAAGRLGGGSDVLGFDTPQSRDHDWGPRLTLFLREEDLDRLAPAIDNMLRQELPFTILGYPTHYGRHADGSTNLEFTDQHPVNHLITVTTAAHFFHDYLALDMHRPMQPIDWLLLPSQSLATVRHGRLFHDEVGEVTAVRQRLHFYPHDVWLYLLAGQWNRLAQEEPFVGRTGDVGDDVGSRLVAARQVHNLMRLAFLLEQAYAPYSKWLGTAFAQLSCAADLLPLFDQVWQAAHWQPRELALNQAALYLARWHNRLQLTAPLPEEERWFYERPYRITHCDQYASALYDRIEDPQVRALPRGLGSLDQLSDATDILSYPQRYRKFTSLFGSDLHPG